jgi:tripartite ATP-independent transporter DctP family solute receptor
MALRGLRAVSLLGLVVAGMLALSACAQPAQQSAPAGGSQPAKPAAEPAKPAAEPAKPAAEPAKPAGAESAKPSGQVVELRAGSSNPKGDVLTDAIDKFAEIVEQKSKGELKIRVFYQSLGVEQQLTQAVMSGSVDIGTISNGNAGRFTSAFFNYDLPFLFPSYDAMLKSLDGPIAKKAIEQFEKDLGVKMLFIQSYGAGRDIQTRNRPLKVPADIRGLKIRVVSTPVDLATFKAWGANPTPVDWAQTYTALQQGTVDGENIPLPIVLGVKHYEVVKHNIRLDYQMIFQTFYINQKTFERLSPAHQKILLEAAAEARAWNWKDAPERVKKAEQELTTKHGMTIYTPTRDEWNQWAAVRDQVWNEVAEQQKGKVDLNIARQLAESAR